MAKKLYIKSYGCQMNVYDSARMADVVTPLGYAQVDDAAEADLIILNTCHIREKAAEKLYSDLGRLRAANRKRDAAQDADGPGRAIIAVAGCVAQAEGAEIMRRAPYVDIVLGPQTYHRLPEMIARATRAASLRRDGKATRGVGILETDFPAESKFDSLPETTSPQGPSAFLTIQEGCDKFCSFCVVPYTRGAEYSRPAGDVLAEARRLIGQGAREITLLGQNVNAYHGEAPGGGAEWGLGRLIRALAEVTDLHRIRYTTSHPRDMDAELIAAHAEVSSLMPYLHLPVQSGSDRILAAMNRQHTAADYLELVAALRAARPDLALSSDFIVGHPGESEEDFQATLRLVREVGYAQAYSFKYSPRPGTPAATSSQLADEIKVRRLAELQALLSDQQRAFNQGFDGQTMPVLFDRKGRNENQLAGRSPHMQAVHVTCRDSEQARRLFGNISPVTIREVHANSLAGALTDEAGNGPDGASTGSEPAFA